MSVIHAHAGYTIPPYYDSLIAKVIAWGSDRDEAIRRMRRALGEMRVEGVRTTLDFHRGYLAHDAFRAGRVHTRYIENEYLA